MRPLEVLLESKEAKLLILDECHWNNDKTELVLAVVITVRDEVRFVSFPSLQFVVSTVTEVTDN